MSAPTSPSWACVPQSCLGGKDIFKIRVTEEAGDCLVLLSEELLTLYFCEGQQLSLYSFFIGCIELEVYFFQLYLNTLNVTLIKVCC